MKHLWKKILSMVLIAALLIQVLPATAKGEELLTENLDMEPKTGLSDMYEYLTYDVGKAGIINVNTYTGNMHITRTDMNFGGERMPVDIKFYYDVENFKCTKYHYGVGWMSSYNQYIIYDDKTEYFQYVNENGTKITFSNTGEITEEGYEIWKEITVYGIGKTGIELYRNKNISGSIFMSVEIRRDGNKYRFDNVGRLVSISNETDQVYITYVSTSTYAIKNIKDSVGRQYQFNYDKTTGYITSIQTFCENASFNKGLTYSIEKGVLKSINYGNNNTVEYGMDYKGSLSLIKNIDGCGYEIEYKYPMGKIFGQIYQIKQKAGIGTEQEETGKEVRIKYLQKSQTSIIEENMHQIYMFDLWGRILKYRKQNIDAEGNYNTIYGYDSSYDYFLDENGETINDLVDVIYYDINGVVDNSNIENDIIGEETENNEEINVTEKVDKKYVTVKDSYGNALKEITTFGDFQQTSSYKYIFYGDLLSSVTDINGSTYKYSYSSPINKPTAITDANGNKTSYTYNSLLELASVKLNVSGIKKLADDLSIVEDDTVIGIEYLYEKGRLTKIQYGDICYSFSYDKWGNLLTVLMDDRNLITYNYGENSYKGLVHSITYGNGECVYYKYNDLEQVVEIGYKEDTPCFKYTYTAHGDLEYIWDIALCRVTQFTENGYRVYEGDLETCNKILYEYSGTECHYSEYILGKVIEHKIETEESVSWLQVLNDVGEEIFKEKVVNDGFERLQEKELTVGNFGILYKYEYITNGNQTGNRISDYIIDYVSNSQNKNLHFSYTYDGNGNIISVEEKEQNISRSNWTYRYDEVGQLVEVYNKESGVRYAYVYDKHGNLICKEEYSVSEDGTEILIEQVLNVYDGMIPVRSQSTKTGTTLYTTDAIGSITEIATTSGTRSLTWGNGSMPLEIAGDDYQASYEYNHEGLRILKDITKEGVRTSVHYEWGKNGLAGFTAGTDTVVILYGQDGTPIGFSLNDTVYTYIKNLQGDVLRILDTDGSTVVEYVYDPWGVPTIIGDTALAAINPCSYRCYDYDEESGFYYLQSRYYNPQTGRFLNVDDTKYLSVCDSISCYNLFSYCKNNPVAYEDKTGTIAITTCVIIGMIAGGIIGGVASKLIYGKVNGWWVLGGAVAGGVLGYFGGAFFGASGIKAGTLASKINMSKVRWLGKIGEKLSSIPKGKAQIDSITGSAKYRIPDFWSKEYKLIGEVKNVKQLSYTKQIEDYLLYAKREGYTFFLQVRKTTQLSSTLKKLVDAGDIVLLYIK